MAKVSDTVKLKLLRSAAHSSFKCIVAAPVAERFETAAWPSPDNTSDQTKMVRYNNPAHDDPGPRLGLGPQKEYGRRIVSMGLTQVSRGKYTACNSRKRALARGNVSSVTRAISPPRDSGGGHALAATVPPGGHGSSSAPTWCARMALLPLIAAPHPDHCLIPLLGGPLIV
jgi:hypothetical protein